MLQIREDGDNRNDKELYVQFDIKDNVVPVAQKPRPVPYYLQKPLKLWSEQCVEDDIFEHVPADEPVTWCSPIVVQPKPRYLHVANDELQPHMIRTCIDLRVPNKYMERNRITHGPVVEDFIYKFHECSLFKIGSSKWVPSIDATSRLPSYCDIQHAMGEFSPLQIDIWGQSIARSF